jgi:RecB family endonuclease NucS
MFALAESADEARALINKEMGYHTMHDDLRREPKVYDTPVGFYVYGGG